MEAMLQYFYNAQKIDSIIQPKLKTTQRF